MHPGVMRWQSFRLLPLGRSFMWVPILGGRYTMSSIGNQWASLCPLGNCRSPLLDYRVDSRNVYFSR
jgi:hypothetical protein